MHGKFTMACFVVAFCAANAPASSLAATIAERGISVQPRARTAISKPQYAASYALIIGIDKYTHGWPQLQNAVKDAERVAAEMRRRGFNVTLSKNPKSHQLKQTLEQFYAVKGQDPAARLFVWYAGHGHTLDGEGYLVPADSPRPDWADRNLVDFKLKALNMQRFNEYSRLANSRHRYTVFDSCFGGRIFGATSTRTPLSRLDDKARPMGQFLTAGSAAQKVADDGGFRRLFIRALNDQDLADGNRDGYLTSTELGRFMGEQYSKLTKGRQTPRSNKIASGNFTFRILPPAPRHFVATKPVNIWTYDKGSFERIIFDWPNQVSYQIKRSGNQTRLVFEAQAKLNIAPLVGKRLRNVGNAQIHHGTANSVVTLDIPPDRYVHDFTDGNQIVLDVTNPQIAKSAPRQVQLASYPPPRTFTRSLPDIITRTARIFQMLQPHTASRTRFIRRRPFRRQQRRWR